MRQQFHRCGPRTSDVSHRCSSCRFASGADSNYTNDWVTKASKSQAGIDRWPSRRLPALTDSESSRQCPRHSVQCSGAYINISDGRTADLKPAVEATECCGRASECVWWCRIDCRQVRVCRYQPVQHALTFTAFYLDHAASNPLH